MVVSIQSIRSMLEQLVPKPSSLLDPETRAILGEDHLLVRLDEACATRQPLVVTPAEYRRLRKLVDDDPNLRYERLLAGAIDLPSWFGVPIQVEDPREKENHE